MTIVKYPEFRASVISFLGRFADPEHVRRVWLDKTPRSAADPVDCLDVAATELYNEMNLYPDPSQTIGWVLVSAAEAVALKRFFDALDQFVDRFDIDDFTAEQTKSDEWLRVQAAARDFIASIESD